MGVTDRNGWNPMHQICSLIFWGEQGQVLKELAGVIATGSLNALTRFQPIGKTPLMLLCKGLNRNLDTAVPVGVLIDAKADMEIVCPRGQTALGFAASVGLGDVVQVFIDKGANVYHTNSVGKNIADLLADSGKDRSILQELARRGVRPCFLNELPLSKSRRKLSAPNRVARNLRTLHPAYKGSFGSQVLQEQPSDQESVRRAWQ